MNYSQNDEQEAISRFFKRHVGLFLEIGAFDGVEFSNTRALLEAGWGGVMVEPDPRNIVSLIRNTALFNDRASIVACAITGKKSSLSRLSLDETDGRGWASTITERCRPGVLRLSPCRLFVPTMHIEDLCRQYEGFDFISLDAEGADFEILTAMPKDHLQKCRLLCVEPHNAAEREQMRGFLMGEGFKTWHETPENLMVARV